MQVAMVTGAYFLARYNLLESNKPKAGRFYLLPKIHYVDAVTHMGTVSVYCLI